MKKVLLLLLLLLSPLAYSDAQLDCLSRNIYFEARDQSLKGQVSVAFVTINRVEDRRWPNNICDVVKQGYSETRKDCQFSWYCDRASDTAYETEAWEHAQAVAAWVMNNHEHIVDPTGGATHYHTHEVAPYWADYLMLTVVIDDHRFYSY